MDFPISNDKNHDFFLDLKIRSLPQLQRCYLFFLVANLNVNDISNLHVQRQPLRIEVPPTPPHPTQ